jgi:hypothetical protein
MSQARTDYQPGFTSSSCRSAARTSGADSFVARAKHALVSGADCWSEAVSGIAPALVGGALRRSRNGGVAARAWAVLDCSLRTLRCSLVAAVFVGSGETRRVAGSHRLPAGFHQLLLQIGGTNIAS